MVLFKLIFYFFLVQATCKTKGKSVLIGEKFSSASFDLFENLNDYVFIFLPCDKSKYSIDLSEALKILGNSRFLLKFFSQINKLTCRWKPILFCQSSWKQRCLNLSIRIRFII